MYYEASTTHQHQRIRDLENVNPIYERAAATSIDPVGNDEVVRQVWVENRTLKKRIHQLEDELAQYKSQTAEQLERCRRQIQGLSEKLEQAKSSSAKRLRDEVKKTEAKRVKEEKASKKASSKAAKKAKTSKAATTVRVTPLGSVPPPPAPPPVVVIEVRTYRDSLDVFSLTHLLARPPGLRA
jgi:DNA anti-recombination protein RmuC